MTFRRRLEFTAATKREAYDRSRGICECHRIPGWTGCGCLLGPGNTFYEHINPDNLGGANDLDNCAALTKTCWKRRTAEHNLPVIAKANRQRDRERGIKPIPRQVLAGTFRSGLKLPMNGSVPIVRATKQPLWRPRAER